jgi:putative ABC transport system substrate-binding protein
MEFRRDRREAVFLIQGHPARPMPLGDPSNPATRRAILEPACFGAYMRRREFLIGGAAAAWPVVARAQQLKIPTIGYLTGSSLASSRPSIAAFLQGLKQLGFSNGEHFTLELRASDDDYLRLPALATDLINRQATVLATAGNVAARVAMEATTTIPIVFYTGDDPVAVRLVDALNKPRRNVTGVSGMAGELPAKRLEVLHELVPTATTIGVIVNPANANAEADTSALRAAARSIGLQLQILLARTLIELENGYSVMIKNHFGAALINTDAFFRSQTDKLVVLAERYKLPTIYWDKELALSGGLVSYGAFRAIGRTARHAIALAGS